MMRVLQVTAWDNVGDRFNGSVIHRALPRRGHHSAMAVKVKILDIMKRGASGEF